jgi:hypothetical protein
MKYSKIIVILGLLLTSLLSADQIVSRDGDIVTVIASGEYIMGDSDNRKESRTMALTQAKINASEVAGTYIESNFESITQQIDANTVAKVTKQELKSFSAGILQNEIMQDTMEMLADKSTIYKVTIKAKIDLAILRERVKQLGDDKAKKDRLLSLERENQKLSSTLEKLSEQMRTLENAKSVKPEEIKALHDERESLFTKIEKNEGATKLVFEKGAILNEYQQKVATATEIANVVNNLFDKHLSAYATVNIGKPKIISQDGNMYKLEFKYSVNLDIEKIVYKLKENSINCYTRDEGYIVAGLALDYDYYNDLGIYGILEKLIPLHRAYIVFSLPNGKVRQDLYDESELRSSSCDSSILLFDKHRSNSITFEVSEEQLSTFSEITSTIEVEKGYK